MGSTHILVWVPYVILPICESKSPTQSEDLQSNSAKVKILLAGDTSTLYLTMQTLIQHLLKIDIHTKKKTDISINQIKENMKIKREAKRINSFNHLTFEIAGSLYSVNQTRC